jgi:sensor histidine kinase YesM
VVEDNGPGLADDAQSVVGRGVGLTNTVERLRQLYGSGHRLGLSSPEGGGLRLEIVVPYREGPAPERAS